MYTTSIFSTSSGEPHRSPRQATAAPEKRLLRRAAPPLVGRALASSYLYGVLGATRALPLPSPSDARTRTRSRSTAPPHAVHTIPRIGHKYRLVSCLSVSSGHTGSAESKNSIGKLPALLSNGPDASISRRWPQPRPLIAAISARSSRTQKSPLTQ